MPVNPELQGRSFPPTEPLRVTAERVQAFAAAVFSGDPASPIAPPTFPVVVQQAALDVLLADPSTGFEIHQVVHGEQRFSLERTIAVGDELTGTLTVTSIRTLGSNAMLTAETLITDAAGERVGTATSLLVIGGGE